MLTSPVTTARAALADVVEQAVGMTLATAVQCLGALGLSEKHVCAMQRAIIDSGASCTYVPGDVELRNATKGGSCVWVANGQKEMVVETGELRRVHEKGY